MALLLPTLSHLAYANEHGSWTNPIPATPGVPEMLARVGEIDRYAAENRLLSIYERHTDGTRRRPTPRACGRSSTCAPATTCRCSPARTSSAPTSKLVAWLDARGIDVDVITDEDLHEEGLELLAPLSRRAHRLAPRVHDDADARRPRRASSSAAAG